MKKINFKKPHFIIPLILLPFLFIFYIIFIGTDSQEITDETNHEIVEGLNVNLPNAKDDLKTSDRIQAYQDALKSKRTETGMGDIIAETGIEKLEDETTQRQKDSLLEVFSKAAEDKRKMANAADNRRIAMEKANLSRESLLAIRKKSQTRNAQPEEKKTEQYAPKQNEMEAFKSQMKYLDSLQHPEKYETAEPEEIEETDPIYEISRTADTGTNGSHFNTIKADLNQTLISAILDEGIQAWEGSRVRIRLLEPIFIDGRLLNKGQYLYGICSGFSAQRLEITVSSVVIEDEIFPLNISLYDNDGIEGIYIPESSFRDFTKQLGANSSQAQINVNQNGPRDNTQALYQSVTRAVQSSTKAIQKALKKNKARLKYNTMVYLVNTKQN